jgi:hypothetical protein
MNTENKGVEFYVGLFLVIGILFIGAMFVQFGGVLHGTSGPLPRHRGVSECERDHQGTPRCLLAGAAIGYVEDNPYTPRSRRLRRRGEMKIGTT